MAGPASDVRIGRADPVLWASVSSISVTQVGSGEYADAERDAAG
jgi:hypothetical protein